MAVQIKNKSNYDHILILVILLLIIIGSINLFSSASNSRFGTSFQSYLFYRHIVYVVISIIIFFGVIGLRISRLSNYKYVIALMAILLLTMTFIPHMGICFAGSSRWFALGPITITPAPLAILLNTIYLSCVLAQEPSQSIDRFFLWHLMPTFIVLNLFLYQPSTVEEKWGQVYA